MRFAVATMDERKHRTRNRGFFISLCSAVLFLTLAMHGCAAKRVEHEDKVVTSSSADDGTRGSLDSEYRHEESHSETRETAADAPGCSGILSCAVSAVGEVLAFPFRAVGFIFQSLF